MKNIEEIALRVAAAYEALSSIDDCARMDVGVDAMGPRKVLEQFIADVEKLAELSKQEPVSREFQGRDGKWYGFIDEKHYKNTVADGSWPIRDLFTHPLPTEAIEQRTAEACAKMARSHMAEPECPERAAYIADDIELGKWREYL